MMKVCALISATMATFWIRQVLNYLFTITMRCINLWHRWSCVIETLAALEALDL